VSKSTAAIVVLAAAYAGSAVAGQKARASKVVGCPSRLASVDEANRWINYYYLHRCPEVGTDALGIFSKERVLEKNATALSAFFGQLIAQTPHFAPRWIEEARRLGEPASFFMAQSIWFSRTKKRDALLASLATNGSPSLRQYVDGLKKDTAPEAAKTPAADPQSLDVLWAGFLATGDTIYVGRVIAALSPGVPALAAGAAKWSLTSMATQHPRVLAACQAARDKAASQAREQLSEIVDEAKKDPLRVPDESKL
jgi:hypothetical protein